MTLGTWLRAALLLLLTHAAIAQPLTTQPLTTQPLTAESREAERAAAWSAAAKVATPGPTQVPLLDQATLAVPKGMAFIPRPEAMRVSSALGNRPGPDLVGMVTTFDDDSQWVVVIRHTAEGYVRDDDARDLKPDDVLASLREGTAEANKERAQRGFPELELLGWRQPPAYDAVTRHLTWALGVKEVGAAEDDAGVNFNTRVLGRDGYFSLNLVTDADSIDKDRALTAPLVASLAYVEGKRYTDFAASSDRVAEYGLAALIGVVAAKKLGLIALAGVFVAKFAKVGLLALAGIGLAAKRLFRRKPTA